MRVAAMAMRQLLHDHARVRGALKRGAGARRISLEDGEIAQAAYERDDLLALDDALTELAQLSPRQAEVVELRFLAGLSEREAAATLGIAERTVRLDWQMARAWLERKMNPDCA